MNRVCLVHRSDGWNSIYINGKSVHQDFDISIRDFMFAIQEAGLAKEVDFKEGYLDSENTPQTDWGSMPNDFSEIEEDVEEL